MVMMFSLDFTGTWVKKMPAAPTDSLLFETPFTIIETVVSGRVSPETTTKFLFVRKLSFGSLTIRKESGPEALAEGDINIINAMVSRNINETLFIKLRSLANSFPQTLSYYY
jgi:hypothetical protein